MNTEKEEFTISEEDKQNFFKAFLSDTPYSEEMALFDGQFKLKFRTMTTRETTAVYDQLRQSQSNLELTNDPNYIVTMTNFRLAISLIEIDGVPFNQDITLENYKPKDEYDSYIKARAEKFKNWPIFKLSGVIEAFKAFEHKVVSLTDAIQTENFWRAAK